MRTAGAASATAVLVAGLMAALPCTADPEAESAEPVVCFFEVDFDDRATWASQGSSLHPTDLDVIQLLEPFETDRVTRAHVAHLLLDPGPTARDALAPELLAFQRCLFQGDELSLLLAEFGEQHLTNFYGNLVVAPLTNLNAEVKGQLKQLLLIFHLKLGGFTLRCQQECLDDAAAMVAMGGGTGG